MITHLVEKTGSQNVVKGERIFAVRFLSRIIYNLKCTMNQTLQSSMLVNVIYIFFQHSCHSMGEVHNLMNVILEKILWNPSYPLHGGNILLLIKKKKN